MPSPDGTWSISRKRRDPGKSETDNTIREAQNLKILIHINSLGRGGAERVVSILSGEFIKMGHQVVIATEWTSEDEYALDPSVSRVHAGLLAEDENKSRISKIVLRYTRLRKCVLAERPDVVLSFCNKANFRSAAALAGTGIPLIVSVRNDPVTDYAPYRISTWLMEHIAAGCVFQTEQAKEFFSKAFQGGSCIILNPVSVQYTDRPFRYRAENAAGEGRSILSVGRITPQKNFVLLVRAFRLIADKVPDARVLIYGDVQEEDYAEQLKREISGSGLEDRILLMGLSEDVASVLEHAYMFVLSSDYEGMPNALLEAMAMGLPCVATDCPCGGPATLITNDVSGLLVSAGDPEALAEAMLQVLEHPEYANRLSGNAAQIRQQVQPEKVASEWIRFIDSKIG